MNKTLIKDSLEKGISYERYRAIIKKQIELSNAAENNELIEYSILNNKRMDRLDKTLKLSEETKNYLTQLTKNFNFLVLAEGWCGDAAQILPVLNKIVEATDNIDLKIVLRDENEELMNLFLTNGGKAIPKLIVIDSENNVINSWGPRPSIAAKMVQDYKAEKGSLDAEFKKDLQIWYNKDKGLSTQKDLLNILKTS